MACKRSGVRIPVAPQVSPGETPISSPPRQPSRSSDRHLTVVLGGMNEHRAPSPDRRWHPRHRRSQAPLNSCRPAGEAAESVICPAERAGGQIPGGLGTRGGDRPPANEPCRWPGDRMPSRPLRLCSRRLPDRTFRRHSRSVPHSGPLSRVGRLCAVTGLSLMRRGPHRTGPPAPTHMGASDRLCK